MPALCKSILCSYQTVDKIHFRAINLNHDVGDEEVKSQV